MPFTIEAKINGSEKNRLTKNTSTIGTFTGTLRADSSIVDPIITVEADLSSLVQCNYLTISTFGRSYFVTDIISVNAQLVEIHGHCDVLSSFASQIRGNSAIIKKQENDWNLYLNDGTFKTYQNPNVLTKEFPSGFSTQEFVLAIAGA